jgi:hypothetical protein
VNRLHTTFAITGLCALIVGWQFWHQASEGPQIDGPLVHAGARADQPPTEPSMTAAHPEQHPAPAQQQTENVLGFRVLKDRDCEVQLRYIPDAETGELHEAMSCEPLNPVPPHPYESWSNELLAQEAYADAEAAEVLGLRFIRSEDPDHEQTGLSLVYRAAALSGNPGVFGKAIGARYAYVSKNGKPQIDNLKQLLVFSHLGRALGGQAIATPTIERELRGHDVPEEELSRIRQGSRVLLEQMADLQTEITGSTSIREALENA